LCRHGVSNSGSGSADTQQLHVGWVHAPPNIPRKHARLDLGDTGASFAF
jgi:hypothetical protein